MKHVLKQKIVGLLIGMLMLVLISIGCTKEVKEEAPVIIEESTVVEQPTEHPKVKVEMEDGGIMVFELYPEYAPETVNNFLGLVESGFYDGLKFHRIIKGFMAQSGDPLGNGTGGSDTTIKGEFAKNGFKQNTLKHEKGVLSMARSRDMDSGSSQFFIMDGEVSSLDGEYAAFGKLIEGMETLDVIVSTPVEKNPQSGEMSLPTIEVFIRSMEVIGD